MIKALSVINIIQLGGSVIFIILALVHIIKKGWHGRLLQWASVVTFVALLAGGAFGKYYASTAPRRLKAIEKLDPNAAIKGYTEAIKLNSGDSNLYYSRGMIYFAQGNYGEALSDLTRSLELSPNDAWILLGRGMVFAQLHDTPSAKRDLDRATQYAGNNTSALVTKALIAQMEGHADDVIAYATQALSAKLDQSDRCDALLYRGTAYMSRSGDLERALLDFKEAESACSGPLRESAFYGEAETLSRLHKPDQALEALGRALQIEPKDWAAHYNRSALLAEMGQLAAALAELNTVIELQPNQPAAYRARAKVYSSLGEKDKAEADLVKADKLAYSFSSHTTAVFVRHPMDDRWLGIPPLQEGPRK